LRRLSRGAGRAAFAGDAGDAAARARSSVTAKTWSDPQLFWIVKHGMKFTPMPAWPVQDRDDEVRRMAAFARRLPDMSPAEYRTLACGPGRIAGG
jgi:hypothetical protein